MIRAHAKSSDERVIGENLSKAVILKAAIVGALSFILTAGKLFFAMSPFGVAFLSALPMNYAVTALIGTVVGSIVFSSSAYMPYYIISLVAVFLMKLCFAKLFRVKAKPFLLCLISTSMMLATALIYTSISNSAVLDLPLMLMETIMAGSLTYFYSLASNALLKKNTTGVFPYVTIASIIILSITTIISLCGIEIMNINFGVIASVLVVYIIMNKFGVVGASISSIVVAIALNLYSFSMIAFTGMLIMASFLAGIFSPLKKLCQIAVFIATCTFCLFLLGAPIDLVYRLIEIFFATALFVLLPQRLFSFLETKTKDNTDSPTSSLFQTSVKTKLSFASDTIRDLQNDLMTVSKRFSQIDLHNINSVYDAAADKACRGCSMQLGCWDKDYQDTVRAFKPINEILRRNGRVLPDEMPQYFQDNCCKLSKLSGQINDCYQAFSVKEQNKRHVEESRNLVVEQFNSIADMLMEVSDDLSEISGYDSETSRIIAKAFCKLEYEPTQVICAIDRFGRICVEIYSDHAIKNSVYTICQALCEATQRDFDLPCISKIGTKTKIALFEKASFTVDFAGQQACFGDNKVCGDSYDYFLDAKGYAYLILSDGMGQGKRAAIDSVMTCSILLKLIKAGFGLESAIKLINSSLLVKSSDESLATIDIARIDLYTGKTEFIKAGASASYLYSKGNCVKIGSDSLPVGILQGIEFDKKYTVLRENDIVVLTTDGATEQDEQWIQESIPRLAHLNAREISSKLLFEAHEHNRASKGDDITILVAKLSKGI